MNELFSDFFCIRLCLRNNQLTGLYRNRFLKMLTLRGVCRVQECHKSRCVTLVSSDYYLCHCSKKGFKRVRQKSLELWLSDLHGQALNVESI